VSGEIDAFGVFMPIALVTGVSAFIAVFVLRRMLRLVNAYAFIWHAGLFDVAMFVVLWWLFACAAGTPTT
jgi:protein AaeX